MSRGTKRVAAILCIVAMLSFSAWPIYKYVWHRFGFDPASRAVFERTRALVEKNPQLQPAWDKAMEDGVLTFREARAIIESAGEKVEPED